MAAAHAGVAKTADVGDIHVAKASGANARTVAEIVTKGAELKDKPVLVRGKVVKYNPEIMGKNWIHLRDGSGSASDNSNDVLVTTTGSGEDRRRRDGEGRCPHRQGFRCRLFLQGAYRRSNLAAVRDQGDTGAVQPVMGPLVHEAE